MYIYIYIYISFLKFHVPISGSPLTTQGWESAPTLTFAKAAAMASGSAEALDYYISYYYYS